CRLVDLAPLPARNALAQSWVAVELPPLIRRFRPSRCPEKASELRKSHARRRTAERAGLPRLLDAPPPPSPPARPRLAQNLRANPQPRAESAELLDSHAR